MLQGDKTKKVNKSSKADQKALGLKNNKVAIIGMSGFFPESDSIEEFWEKLSNQDSFLKEIPDDHDPKRSDIPKLGAYIKNLRGFDAKLFHVISKEATYMTPQQRLLLMSVWNLLEDACILPSSLKDKRVAVIVGKEINPYMEYLTKAPVTAYTCLGMAQTYLPNRISNYFNFKGPSYCVDTSCSSGLTALHQGKKMLKNNEVDYVIAAGVSLIYGKEWTRSLFSGSQSMGLMTTDIGGSRPFQQEASGFTPSEGVISVLLKRGDEAVKDQDNIHAFVLGSESSHVGGNGNIAFPDANQQSKAIVKAYEEAAVPPETITYLESHAASAILADSQEIKAFKLADKHFQSLKNETVPPCKISTLKPNIGHMHAASGLASLVRMVYSFKHQKKLGIKHFKALSNEIKLDNSRYYITSETEEWTNLIDANKTEIPRRGAINNSGGGGNVIHVVLEEYVASLEEEIAQNTNKDNFFLALSSTKKTQFINYAQRIKNYLDKNPHCNMQQLEYQYLTTRKGLEHRIVFRYKSIEDLTEKLTKYIESEGKRGYYVDGSVKESLSLNEIFLKNNKVVQFLNELNEKKDKSFLFDLWAKGYEEPVRKFYETIKAPKTSFPVYPFNLEPYWLDIYAENNTDKLYNKSSEIIENSLVVKAKYENNEGVLLQENNTTKAVEELVEDYILNLIANLLDIEISHISADEEIGDYGFNSVALTEFANLLNDYYSINLQPTAFYNYPTVKDLSSFLLAEYGDLINKKHNTITKQTSKEVNIQQEKNTEKRKPCKVNCKLKMNQLNKREPIAIVGMSGRFPQSPNLNVFWENIKDNKDLITEIPKNRWNWEDFYGEPDENNKKTKAKWGGFIDDVDKFDPLHFNISPKEAELMDPQHRLALEEVYHALEEGGINPKSLSGTNTGVFIGSYFDDYATLVNRNGITDSQTITGLSQSMLTNRISYLLDLHGPSETIDTACSSSLIAIHRGIESIRNGSSDLIIAGGISLVLTPDLLFPLSHAGFLSKDGRCKTFDQSANGYVRGEGVGIVVLKPLSKAIADGNKIHAIIKSTAENHGGKANTLTSPNPNAQKELLLKAYRSAGVNPSAVSYIETHGTGTPLGDPIETEGLKLAFKQLYKENNLEIPEEPQIKLGSVKTNIGHLEPAAGISGVLKVVQSLKHKTIPGNPHLKTPNQYLELSGSPFELQRHTTNWESKNGLPRVAGVSSFGAGGSNAHVVIQEYNQKVVDYRSDTMTVILLSAKNNERLKVHSSNVVNYLNDNPFVNLYDLAYTLQIGRESMQERLAIVTNTIEDLKNKLKEYLEGNTKNVFVGKVKKNKTNTADTILEVENAISTDDTTALAQLWINGASINWKSIYKDGQLPNILTLPGYPFARQSYWIDISKTNSQVRKAPIQEKPEKNITLFKEVWNKIELTEEVLPKGKVIFINVEDRDKALVAELQNTLEESIIINDLISSSLSLKNISAVIDLGASINTDYKWLKIVQEVINQSEEDKITFLHISEIGEATIGKGLYQSLGAEYSKLSSKCLELDYTDSVKINAKAIINSIATTSEHVRLKAKGNSYEALGLEPFNIDVKINHQTISYPILITGGTRGIGMACARHLVSKHEAKKLILLGRQQFPERSKWDNYKNENSQLGQKVRDILSLEELGADIRVVNCSLTNKEELGATFLKVKQDWGPIKGMLHCAGIVDTETPAFIRKTLDTIKSLQEPKVTGLNNLYEVLKEHDLNFGILFSSISALSPQLGAGQCDYAMANAYLDSFAQKRHAEGYRSVQWPSWKETGMGEVTGGVYGGLGLLSLTNQEGANILDQVISLNREEHPHTIIPVVYDSSSFKVADLLKIPKKSQKVTVKVTKSDSSVVSNWVNKQISEALKLPESVIEIDTPFQEYGVDSILLADLVKQMEKKLEGVSLSPTIILENPTVGMLSNYFIENFSEVLSKILNQSLPSSQENVITKSNEENKEEIHRNNVVINEPIAVVGMGCHFPDAKNIGEFWDNLINGKDSIREVPSSRWHIDEHYSPNKEPGKSYSKWGAFIEDIEDFDPNYFGIPKELASQIDPLERQWLEVSAEAIKDAGYTKKELSGKAIGVYAGSRVGNFRQKLKKLHKDFIVGTGQNFITAHLAHIYNFKGPNMVVDTACSSSLTAIDLAVKSLRQGETEMALAGGVDILLDEAHFIGLSTAEVLAIDGKTKTFDESANGTGLGEGCGVLLLKRLTDAISDDDKIYGVIDGTAVNNDGSTMGITTPNPKAQQELIETAIANGKIDRSTISYIEAHGTGTLIGDPIELKGITAVLSKTNNTDKQVCAVGSVKTNIGHLMSAAGVAGVIKSLLAISAKQLPPTLNCNTPNPRFDFSNSPVYPVQKLENWDGANGLLRAGISAFGLGGNNAHVIVSNQNVPLKNQVKPPFNKTNIQFNKQRYWPENKSVSSKITNSMDAYLSMTRKKEGLDWVFQLNINNDNYIIRDHKVHNTNIVPGVTYLDLILRCGKELFEEVFEINRVLFTEPLATNELYNRHVEVRFRKGNYSLYEVMVRSKRVNPDGIVYGKWDRHMNCRLNTLGKITSQVFNIDAFINSCEHKIAVDNVYKSARSVEIVHGEFMQTKGIVYQNENEELMKLHLSDLSESYREQFYLHPAFLDGATFAGSSFHAIENNQVSYIPFSIDAFKAYNNLPSTIYVYSKHNVDKYNVESEIIKSDIHIYDENGQLLCEFKGLTIKKIRHASLITTLLHESNTTNTQTSSVITNAKEQLEATM